MTAREITGTDVFALRGPNRRLMLSVWWNVGLLAASLAALPFDHRLILGLKPWIKPIKFDLSFILFDLTIAVLLSALYRHATPLRSAQSRLRQWISRGIGISMIIENTIIAMQSLRGVRSHMNYTSWFNALSFATMGVFIAINTVLVAFLLVLFLVIRTSLPRAITLGVELGLFFVLAASLEGGMMITRCSAHTVGDPDGGAGLPFVNWNTIHGDLRVAHFFALHALQLLTLCGWALSTTRLPVRAQVALTFAFSVRHFAVVWKLFADAVAGRPLLG